MMKKGFTLVELLIVISILIIMLGAGLATFNSFNRRERLKQTALTLKSTLRLAQTKAISVEKPTSGCTSFTGMYVSFTATTYSIGHQCNPEGIVGGSETVTLPPGITFSPVPSAFTILSQTNTINIASPVSLIIINGSELYSLTVSPNGSVNDGGFQ
ncbi:prepilin-type N-terminal cleavage/methylation domain-containing protein [Candidatus Gottesmanbacteria bacterium]|nr:prepilin-type N-terminal cleavage/methylation domain-containing protein [Candidatus Gottesmanbacteria bacterium]